MKRFILWVGVSVLSLACTINSYAATLQVYPVTLGFCGKESAQAIYVRNTGSATIGAQIRVYAWKQQNNKDNLTETQDVMVSPPMTTIPVSRQQLIRVILTTPGSGDNEQAYRIIVDELPGKNNMADKDGVRFLLRYSIPVFVNCKDTQPISSQLDVSIDRSVHPLMLKIKNNGTQHVKLSDVFIFSGKRSVAMSKGLLGYVLPHSEKEWPLPNGITTASSLSLNLNDNAKTQIINITP
ncbi:MULTISPECIES: molecular chaperone [unclassified Citrobacter]|uniref:fimbrial biogenesis chaperone n=1 Tax=unclassified Citrobacter TaxID=2644389 RepID=UPI0025765C68|nr:MULTISPECIES: molecular chaperone [unclassified Citrobacter]MDM2753221.1 molecular chaperone [Citrobacter sp. Cpo221]MDM2790388.1 molecular chaperone [Citrobacter sp. Cpo113]MDM2841040.1 molecular chaperone [Citrobacter sp. Cpo086]